MLSSVNQVSYHWKAHVCTFPKTFYSLQSDIFEWRYGTVNMGGSQIKCAKMKHFQCSQFQLIPLLNKYENCFPVVCVSKTLFWCYHHRKAEVFSFKMIPYLCQLLVSQPANSIINVGKSTFELVIPIISSVAMRWSSFSLHWLLTQNVEFWHIWFVT